MYAEDELLPLSGLQHFAFCRRQWALIHIEQVWQENLLTIEGRILHEKVHASDSEKRGDLIITRSLPVSSATLGIRGVCDVVELHRDPDGVEIQGRPGRYLPFPVEYKRGRPKQGDADVLQLCAQAMCLEEMLACRIPQGALFYGEMRHRLPVHFDDLLRSQVHSLLEEMHSYYRRGYTPKVKPTKSCRSCSIADLCLPKLGKNRSAADYVRSLLQEVEE